MSIPYDLKMALRQIKLLAPDAVVEAGLTQIREEMRIPRRFDPSVMAELADVEPRLPDTDLTHIPFVTIDPPGARDLDQAVYVEGRKGGYRVNYAIADVAAFVAPGGLIDTEARVRGQTLYGPDLRTPLYPVELSEGMASLLPDQDRPALVWRIDLDVHGEVVDGTVGKAMVRSRAQLSYEQTQDQLDSGSAPHAIRLLAEVGRLRQLLEVERGAVTLNIPEQQIEPTNGGWALRYRAPLPVEGWNAQQSLLTGIFAAGMMADANIGLLRTLPPGHPERLERLRRVARGLEINWPGDVSYPDLIRSLDGRIPTHAALLAEATTLFTGAGYQALPDGEPHPHAALATLYAHTTAPLRRLVDRFVGETCLALCQGVEVPGWVTEALPTLPEIMAVSASRAGQYEAACVNLVEAALMSGREGEVFAGVVVEVDDDKPRGEVQLREPAVLARIGGEDLDLGQELLVRVDEVSVPERRVHFEQA